MKDIEMHWKKAKKSKIIMPRLLQLYGKYNIEILTNSS